MEDMLLKAINYEMEQLGNTDVVVRNIHFFTEENRQYDLQMFPIFGF